MGNRLVSCVCVVCMSSEIGVKHLRCASFPFHCLDQDVFCFPFQNERMHEERKERERSEREREKEKSEKKREEREK